MVRLFDCLMVNNQAIKPCLPAGRHIAISLRPQRLYWIGYRCFDGLKTYR